MPHADPFALRELLGADAALVPPRDHRRARRRAAAVHRPPRAPAPDRRARARGGRDRRRRRPRRRSGRPRAAAARRYSARGICRRVPHRAGRLPGRAARGRPTTIVREVTDASTHPGVARRRRDRGRRAGDVRGIRHQGRAQRGGRAGASTPPRSPRSSPRARERGLPVVAHVEGAGMTRLALDAGVDVLAHTPFTEAARRRRSSRARRGAASDGSRRSTSIATIRERATTARGEPRPRSSRPAARVLYGTDLGNGELPVGVNARELAALHACRRARSGADRRPHRPVAGREPTRTAVATFVPGRCRPQTLDDVPAWLGARDRRPHRGARP